MILDLINIINIIDIRNKYCLKYCLALIDKNMAQYWIFIKLAFFILNKNVTLFHA